MQIQKKPRKSQRRDPTDCVLVGGIIWLAGTYKTTIGSLLKEDSIIDETVYSTMRTFGFVCGFSEKVYITE